MNRLAQALAKLEEAQNLVDGELHLLSEAHQRRRNDDELGGEIEALQEGRRLLAGALEEIGRAAG